MAHNNHHDSSSNSPEGPPVYGLLTRTLVHSPVIRQIIPARIRSKDLNDVVFIGEAFIELHILTEDGKLRQVGSKTDFQADIRHARVFGSPRKHFYSAQDAIFRQGLASQLQDDTDMRGDGEDTSKQMLPPHILALTLDSGHLAFIYAKDSEIQGEVEFVVSMKRIDENGVHPAILGKSVAIDPRSRALAVAAYQDHFRMYALHSTEELERQVRLGETLNPIKEEKTFDVNGLILHMEFLHPSPDDQDHVILLLFVIDSNQISRLQLYEWWTSRPLRTATRHGHHGFRLSNEITMPLHVIPLVISSAFLLVTEFSTHVVKASDIMSGSPSFAKIAFPPAPRGGQRRALVTSWARPLRTPKYAYDHDDMYLAMEDGDIFFLEVDTQGPNLIQLANKACHLDCSIGTAFASLDFGLTKNDMLVAGGEMSSGGVYLLKIGPHPVETEPKLEESVANWSPVFDFDLVKVPAQGYASGRAERDRVFACTGRGDHGAITELRYGIQARIQGSAEYHSGVRRLWILPDSSRKGYFLLSSLPYRSSLCLLTPSGDWEEASDFSPLEMNETTLAAGSVGNLFSVQVTPSTIIIAQLKEESLTPRRDGDVDMADIGIDIESPPVMKDKCNVGETIVAAALKDGFLVVAIRKGAVVELILATIHIDGDTGKFLNPVGLPTTISEDPTFVTILEINRRMLVVVGTQKATIQMFFFDLLNGLIPVLDKPMYEGNTEGQLALFTCESVALLTANNTSTLLCGLRGGTVIALKVGFERCPISLDRIEEIKFGPTPVQLHPDVRRCDSAFVLAGPELFRFDFPNGKFRASQVVFEESDIEPSLVAFAQINSPDSENIVIGMTKEQIFYADVGESEKVCVRRLRLNETPRKLLFYKPLNVLVVACSRTASDDPRVESEKHIPGKRKSFCSLRFVDPRTGEPRAERDIRDSSKRDLIFGKANEQIYCLAEWNIEIENKPYRYIVLGTDYINVTTSDHKGRVIVLSVINGPSGNIEVRRRLQIQCNAPVFSLAPYSTNSLVYCSGDMIYMKTFNAATKKFDDVAEAKVRSPAVQISVTGPLIHLSCSADSMLIFRFEHREFKELVSDVTARNGFHHFQLFRDFFLATDKQYGIAGLWRPPNTRTMESLVTVVEAELTSSISRIRKGNVRPPWQLNKPRPGVLFPDQDLIAAGVNGSIFQLTLLEEGALRLLKYVQDLYKTRVGMARTSPEREGHDFGQVDGDILVTILKLGGDWLRELVIKSCGGDHNMPKLKELAGRVFFDVLGETELIEEVMEYMNTLVNSVVL